MKLTTNDGEKEEVSKSELIKRHCPKAVYDISNIKDNKLLISNLSKVVASY